MTIGTKSILFGVHQFIIHPITVFLAWWKLYGFPFDPRLWFAFFLHDIGYVGKPNMDGPEGETHPYLGGVIMKALFGPRWYWFTILHSKSLARSISKETSELCNVDKFSIMYMPYWLYIPMACSTGEFYEYHKTSGYPHPIEKWANKVELFFYIRDLHIGKLDEFTRYSFFGKQASDRFDLEAKCRKMKIFGELNVTGSFGTIKG